MDVQFIVPQSLIPEVTKFQAYFNNCKKDKTAISIVGPSGVGKSMFLHIFKKLYGKEFPGKPIVETDCSHYAGVDAAIARSELFGHVQGAFGMAGRVFFQINDQDVSYFCRRPTTYANLRNSKTGEKSSKSRSKGSVSTDVCNG